MLALLGIATSGWGWSSASPPPPLRGVDCGVVAADSLRFTLTFCERDYETLCNSAKTGGELITCLEQHKSVASRACAQALDVLDECLASPSHWRSTLHNSVASNAPPALAPPPNSPVPEPDEVDCNKVEADTLRFTLTFCERDYEQFCDGVQGRSNIITCLEQHRGVASRPCAEALEVLDECLLSPHLLVPMTIASILLLATASMVLLCALLRCCCRYVCILPIQPADDASTVHDEEFSDEDESVGSVTPLPSGVKMAETPQQEPSVEEDDLPAYTEVVQGASIARSKEPAPKDNYRPDVQLQ